MEAIELREKKVSCQTIMVRTVLARTGCLIVASYGNEVNFEQRKGNKGQAFKERQERREKASIAGIWMDSRRSEP